MKSRNTHIGTTTTTTHDMRVGSMERRLLKTVAWAMMMMMMASSWCGLTQAIWVHLPPSESKCISEEIHTNVLVLADFYVIDDDPINPRPNISVKVTSPYGNNLYHAQNVTDGQFAFTAQETGTYLACFRAHPKKNKTSNSWISIDWKTGIAAKDWASVAKKENIEGVELELKKLEEAVQAIHHNLLYLKNRELKMRSVSETANTRVALYSLLSLAVCLVVSALQILYLKQYFHKKKLI